MTRVTKRSVLLVALSCGMMCLPRAYAAHDDNVPDWVTDAAKETLPDYHHEPNAVILLDDSEYTVKPDGHVVLHERVVKKILRPQGRKEAEFVVWYNKDSKINWMRVWSIGPDGHKYQLKDKDFNDYAASSFILYQDDRGRVGKALGGDPGAIVAEEYQMEMPFYRPEIQWQLNYTIPIHRNQVEIQLPPGFLFDTRWKLHDSVAPTNAGNNRWQWVFTDTPGHDTEEVKLAPVGGELLSMMTLHYAGPGTPVPEDWQSLGVWYQGLAGGRTESTAEMSAKARDLTAGITDFYAKAQAIDAFVRGDIRYVAVEVGIGGFQPHAASDIFHNRYGDCKDKATLLASMMSAVGIHSTWLWVDVEHSMDPKMPSLLGDHMIAAIELPEGYESPSMYSVVTAKSGKRFLITDPTWEKTPFGQIEHELQGTYALLVDGAQSQVIQIPVMDPGRNTWARTAHMKLGADGSLNGDVTERMYGDEAAEFRYVFDDSDEHKRSEILDHHVNGDLTGFTLTNVKTENLPDVDKDVILSYTVSASSYSKSMGSLIMVRPRLLGSDTLELDDKPRVYPINLEQTTIKKDDFDVELPAGYVVDELPDPVKVDVGFASYESKTTVEKGMLHYARTYTVREVEIPSKKYSDLRELEGSIASDERSSVILRKAQ